MKDRYKVKIDTWNVGTLLSTIRELEEVLKRKKINNNCFQRTKWKGDKAKE